LSYRIAATRHYSSLGSKTFARSSAQASLEFAALVTTALIVLFATIDFSRALYDLQVMSGLSRQGGNLASRGSTASAAASAVIAGQAPLNLSASGRVIMTSIIDNNGVYTITDQASLGGMLPAPSSKLGTGIGNTATLSLAEQGMLKSGQSIYVAEVFYSFQPITPIGNLLHIALPSTLYEAAYF
jgi:Flp pilus assembly protein TadG